MADWINWRIESAVRTYLRDHQNAHCARCLATALRLNYEAVRGALDVLAPRQLFSRGPCACGATGLSYELVIGWLRRVEPAVVTYGDRRGRANADGRVGASRTLSPRTLTENGLGRDRAPGRTDVRRHVARHHDHLDARDCQPPPASPIRAHHDRHHHVGQKQMERAAPSRSAVLC